MNSDCYYGAQSESFSFFHIPRVLVTDPKFKRLSAEAKLLYGLFLDCMNLSMQNNWYDGHERVFIYYTVAEIHEDMNCDQDKALKLLVELDTAKGIGLIEEEAKAVCEKLMEHQSEAVTLEQRESFIRNFKLGARFMLEVRDEMDFSSVSV